MAKLTSKEISTRMQDTEERSRVAKIHKPKPTHAVSRLNAVLARRANPQ